MLNKLYLFLALLAVVVVGCADDELQPAVTQDTLLFGAFPRLVELRTGEFDLADLQNSAYEMEVDFVDNAGGADIAQYKVYVAFDDNSTGAGRPDYSTESAEFRVYTPADFTEGPNGNLGLTVNIPFTEVAAFAGVPVDSIFSGDRFQIRTEVVKTDGRVFSSANSTPAITNAFGGLFNFNVVATCPLDDSFLTGEYRISYGEVYESFDLFDDNDPVQALGDLNGVTVTLETVAGSTTRRTVSYGSRLWLPSYGFDLGPVTLDFACDRLTSTSAVNTGLSCGDGPIGFAQNTSVVSAFDLEDDSTFEVFYNDFATGGCYGGTLPFSLIFTKVN